MLALAAGGVASLEALAGIVYFWRKKNVSATVEKAADTVAADVHVEALKLIRTLTTALNTTQAIPSLADKTALQAAHAGVVSAVSAAGAAVNKVVSAQ